MLKDDVHDRDMFWHFPAYLQAYKGGEAPFRATPYSSVRSGDWKMIYYYEDGRRELYNLKNDLSETIDLSSEKRGISDKLFRKLSQWIKETDAPVPTEKNPYYVE